MADGGWRRGDHNRMADFDEMPPPPPPMSERKTFELVNAAFFGQLSTIVDLLREGYDIEEVDEKDQWRPIHAAVMGEHDEVVEYLLKQRAEVNAPGPKGMTPLHYACRDNSDALVRILMKGGANAGLANEEGKTPGDLCVGCADPKAHRALQGLPPQELEPPAAIQEEAPAETGGEPPRLDPPTRSPGVEWYGRSVDPSREEEDVARLEAAWDAQEAVKKGSEKKRRDRRFADSDSD
mmetsp:Transcript_25809/g.39265  ORF Transcript_25809/g.39265 Transcript_25809/m.39265 type:complete len:237 (+) Transcript_25809:65-775(+)